jgi:hypothetical protein
MSSENTATAISDEVVYDRRQVGKQMRPGFFTIFAGRGLRDVIDPLGRIYRPHPYDIPQWRFRVLDFCVNFIIMMMDTGGIRYDTEVSQHNMLDSERDFHALRRLLRNIGNRVGMVDHGREESGVPWESSIQLLDVETVRQWGLPYDGNSVMLRSSLGVRYYDTDKMNVAQENKLVAVVTVSSMLESQDIGAKGTKWTLAFDVTEGAGKELLRNELARGWYEVEFYQVPKEVLVEPAALAENQNPQFVTIEF